MGQKVHPTGIRLGIVKDWASKWYADSKMFPEYIHADHQIRTFIKKKLKDASVSRIAIERPSKKCNITIHTARPGIVIGKKGEDIEKLRAEVAQMTGMAIQEVRINISEVRKPELGRAIGCRRHCTAAGASRDVPSRHEARCYQHHACRC